MIRFILFIFLMGVPIAEIAVFIMIGSIIGALPTYLPELERIGMPRDEALLRAFSFDGMVFSDVLRRRLYSDALYAHHGQKRDIYKQIINQSWRDDARNTAQAMVINTWLHGNALLHCDKVTMAHSLEARIPLFDRKLLALGRAWEAAIGPRRCITP